MAAANPPLVSPPERVKYVAGRYWGGILGCVGPRFARSGACLARAPPPPRHGRASLGRHPAKDVNFYSLFLSPPRSGQNFSFSFLFFPLSPLPPVPLLRFPSHRRHHCLGRPHAAAQPLPYGPAQFYYNPAERERRRRRSPQDKKKSGGKRDETVVGGEKDEEYNNSNAEEEDAEEDDEEEERAFFCPLPRMEDATRRLACQESLFCQYQVLERHADGVRRCFSHFHSGPGQLSLSDEHRRRVDCTLLLEPGHFLFLQYHSELHYGGHTASCPLLRSHEGVAPEPTATEAGNSGRLENSGGGGGETESVPPPLWYESDPDQRGRAGYLTSSSEEEEEEEEEEDEKEEGEPEPQKECPWVLSEEDFPRTTWTDDEDDEMEEALASGEFALGDSTQRMNDLQRSYVDYLNEAVTEARRDDPSYPPLIFEVRFEYACDYFHGNAFQARQSGKSYLDGGLLRLLREEHPQDSLVGGVVARSPLGRGKIEEKELLRRLLTDDELCGFVTVRGGAEERRDIASLMQAFCLGKFGSEEDPEGDLGPLASRMEGDRLKKRCRGKCLTMTRLGYDPRQLTTMSVQNLRFLVQERGFNSFTLVHYIHYEQRPYLFPAIFRVIQERHRLKRESPDDVSSISACKLYLNALYGYSYKESSNFCTTRLATHTTLIKTNVMADPRLVSCTIMGTRPTGGARRRSRRDLRRPKCGAEASNAKTPAEELLFAVTRRNPDAAIFNLSELAASVLCSSRLIFFSHILFLLTVMDPTRAQLCYLDTDSLMWFVRHRRLEDNVRREFLPLFERYRNAILEDEDSPWAQNNRLKLEGVFGGSLFTTLKCYTLLPLEENEGDEPVKKTKGIGRVPREKMTPAHFLLPAPSRDDNAAAAAQDERPLTASWVLRATRGLTMTMHVRSARLPNPNNFKRYCVVTNLALERTRNPRG